MKILGIQARINENGRVVIPAVIRKGMGLKLGDSVVMSLDDGVLRVEPLRPHHRVRVHVVQEESLVIAEPGTVASSDLVQERHEESQNVTEDWLG
jgi:AbrB family looped-hinge helix DNA binding protein